MDRKTPSPKEESEEKLSPLEEKTETEKPESPKESVSVRDSPKREDSPGDFKARKRKRDEMENDGKEDEEKSTDRSEDDSNKIVIRGLNQDATEEGVRKLFKECGEIKYLFFPRFNDTGRPKGFSFVQFADKESFEKALKLNGEVRDGRRLNVEQARPKRTSFGRNNTFSGRTRQVFVGNLRGIEFTKDDLMDHFEKCGKIVDVRVPKSYQDNKPKGFAFVEFDRPEDVKNALKFDDKEFKGVKIRVNEEVRRRRRNDRGGYRSGGGGYRSGGYGGYRGGGGGGGYGSYPPMRRYDYPPREEYDDRFRREAPPRREYSRLSPPRVRRDPYRDEFIKDDYRR